MRHLSSLAKASCFAMAIFSAPAFAQDTPAIVLEAAEIESLVPPSPEVATAALATPLQPVMPFDATAVTEDTLSGIAGREDTTQLSYAQQTSQVSRNSIGDNSRTGDARIADNAFQNLSGLSILNVNTGNNVAINAAMNVNIAINPLP